MRQGRWHRIGWLGLGLVVVVLLSYLGISTVIALTLIKPRRIFGSETPAQYGASFQEVSFLARGDQLKLAGWFITPEKFKQPRKVIILVHGQNMSRTAEFGGKFVELGANLAQEGFTVLMLDLRGHGQSESAPLTFGIYERRDVEGAVDWLQAQGFKSGQIGVLGYSMGAASAIAAAAEEPAIGAVVADSSFAELKPLLRQQWRHLGLPEMLLPSSLMVARWLTGCDLTTAKPLNQIAQISPRPVLIIHSQTDRLIPISHAIRLRDSYPQAEYWEIAQAEHGGSYLANPERYLERVVDFLDRWEAQ